MWKGGSFPASGLVDFHPKTPDWKVMVHNYRPLPKDGKGTVFTGVCLSTPGQDRTRLPPSQDRTGVPPPPARTGQGYPPPGQDRTGVYLGQDRTWVNPLPGTGVPPPPPETKQHSEHLLRNGRYASCVHAGGLSCLRSFHVISCFYAIAMFVHFFLITVCNSSFHNSLIQPM